MYGISNSMSTIFSGINQMNNIRLLQATQGKKISAISGVSSATSKMATNDADFLKEYQSSMTGMMDAANALRDNGQTNALTSTIAKSSDTGVASVETKYSNAEAANYTLDVEQIAKAQVNLSEGVDAFAAPSLPAGSLNITTKKGSFDFTVDASGSVNNRAALSDLASRINGSRAGVTASVEVKEGKASLKISSNDTGSNGAFSVSGSFADATGLANQTQSAQDAVYSVTKDGGSRQTFTSSDNEVTIGSYKVTATLKDRGTTTVSVGADSKKMSDAISSLVDSYNSALKTLNNNADRGSAVLKQMKRMILLPTSEKSLKQIGVTVKKDGTFEFDKAKFEKSLATDSKMTSKIVSNMAQGVYQDARSGLNVSSASLLGKNATVKSSAINSKAALSADGKDWSGVQQNAQAMLAYFKAGAYNMSNYYSVGAMFNANI